jgi:hypothetical protein
MKAYPQRAFDELLGTSEAAPADRARAPSGRARATRAKRERQIEDYLAAAALEKRSRATRSPRVPSRPSRSRDTRIDVSGRHVARFAMILQPAALRTSYAENPGGDRFATLAARADEAWLIMTPAGRYLGVLEEWTGREPWAVAKLAEETTVIGDRGVRVRSHLLSASTWRDALAAGARVWWAP